MESIEHHSPEVIKQAGSILTGHTMHRPAQTIAHGKIRFALHDEITRITTLIARWSQVEHKVGTTSRDCDQRLASTFQVIATSAKPRGVEQA